MHAVTKWEDHAGFITFEYEGQAWSVTDHPGRGMTYSTINLELEVDLKAYPTASFTKKVIDDFRRCCPGIAEGDWIWDDNKWQEVSTKS